MTERPVNQSPDTLVAAGGFCAPIGGYELLDARDDIWPNGVVIAWRNRTWKGRLRNWFAWSPDWGTYMRGGPLVPVRLMDLVEPMRVSRGGITFAKLPGFDEVSDD